MAMEDPKFSNELVSIYIVNNFILKISNKILYYHNNIVQSLLLYGSKVLDYIFDNRYILLVISLEIHDLIRKYHFSYFIRS